MRGLGHSLSPALITVFGSCVLRLIWVSTVCRYFHEFWVVMIIYPISWVLTGSMMLLPITCCAGSYSEKVQYRNLVA